MPAFDRADPFDAVTTQTWRDRVEADLKGAPFDRRLVSRLYEGVSLQPLFTPTDWPHAEARSGRAGISPTTRGGSLLSTSRCPPAIRQERREPTPKLVNAALLEDLENGVGGVTLRFDLATRQGLPPSDPAAASLIGRDGCTLARLDDLDAAFQGVHLEMIEIGLEAGGSVLPASAALLALYQRRGIAPEHTRIAFTAAPLAVLARDASLPVSLDDMLAEAASLACFTSAELPLSTAVRVGSAPYHHAGATATQDLAFLITSGIAYLRALTGAGLSVADAAAQLEFSVALGCNQFLAIAKLRAARLLWARVIEASGGNEPARRMRLHARTSKRVLTRRDPWVNLLRNTSCMFAAIVGGADTLTSAPLDDAIGLPSLLARRIARNTPTILLEESHMHRVADPAGGSWFLESLTEDLAQRAWTIVQEIEAMGGMPEALTSGWVHDQIESAFAPRARNVATRKDGIVGVSEFPDIAQSPVEPTPVDFDQIARDAAAHDAEPTHAASVGGPAGTTHASRVAEARDAIAAGATVPQLASMLHDAQTPATLEAAIAPHPYAAPFEELRDRADACETRCGRRPTVLLVTMGPQSEHGPRAGFSRSLFEAGGFRVIEPGAITSIDEAAGVLADSDAHIAVICSTDERYTQLVPELAPALRAAGARSVILAGKPGEREAADRAAGVDRFIYMRCDALEILRDLLHEEGAQ